MSESRIREAIANKKMKCPKCGKPIQKYEKYAETVDSVREGFNVQTIDSHGSRVTLTCGQDGCDFRERTEYWENYIDD
jgi:hypothetical protein